MLPLLLPLLRYRRVRALNTSATIFILSANACLYLCGPVFKLDWMDQGPWAPAACCLPSLPSDLAWRSHALAPALVEEHAALQTDGHIGGYGVGDPT